MHEDFPCLKVDGFPHDNVRFISFGCLPYARTGDETVFRKLRSSQLRHLPVDDVHSGHPEPVRVVQQPSPSFACDIIEPSERNRRHVAPRLVEAPVRWKERKKR